MLLSSLWPSARRARRKSCWAWACFAWRSSSGPTVICTASIASRSVHDWASWGQGRNSAKRPTLDDDQRFSVECGSRSGQEQTFPGADCMQGAPLSLESSALRKPGLRGLARLGSIGCLGCESGLLSDVARFLKSHGPALNAGTRTPPGPRPTKPPSRFLLDGPKVPQHGSRGPLPSPASCAVFAWLDRVKRALESVGGRRRKSINCLPN